MKWNTRRRPALSRHPAPSICKGHMRYKMLWIAARAACIPHRKAHEYFAWASWMLRVSLHKYCGFANRNSQTNQVAASNLFENIKSSDEIFAQLAPHRPLLWWRAPFTIAPKTFQFWGINKVLSFGVMSLLRSVKVEKHKKRKAPRLCINFLIFISIALRRWKQPTMILRWHRTNNNWLHSINVVIED